MIEGKTKLLKETYVVKTKNVLTANDASKKEEVNVAVDKTAQTSSVFEFLQKNGIPTAFVTQLSPDTFLSSAVDMFPIECVVRRKAYGSYLKRIPEAKAGSIISPLQPEFYYKLAIDGDKLITEDDAREQYLRNGKWTKKIITDPYIIMSAQRNNNITADFYDPKIPFNSSNALIRRHRMPINFQQYTEILSLMLNTFTLLEKAWKTFDVELIDIKIEVGVDRNNGKVVIADVIDNDSWRIWPGGNPEGQLDKQAFRDNEDINVVKNKYAIVTDYTRRFKDLIIK